MKVLVIGAHADDPDLGAGGYIAKLTSEGHECIGYVASLFCPRLAHIVEELKLSWSTLGLKFLPQAKQDFDSRNIDRQSLLDELIKLREQLKPDMVITHSSADWHQSHQVVNTESVRAFKHTTMLGYSFPWNEVNGNKNDYFVTLSSDDAAKKLIALKEYKSQSERLYFSHDYQLNRLLQIGLMVNTQYSEAFETIRIIN